MTRKVKKLFVGFIATAMLLSFSSCFHTDYVNIFTNGIFETEIPQEEDTTESLADLLKEITGFAKRPKYYKYKSDTLHPNISAKCGGIYDVQAKKTLFEINGDEKVAPASLTKMVTALTALKYAGPQDVFTVGNEQYSVMKGSSLCYIKIGQKLTLEQLLIGMLLPSGNDAAYTVAVNVARKAAGNTEMKTADALTYFCGLMNKYCEEVGAYDSHFVNPDGWDEENHYSTANDIALFATKVLENDLLSGIVSNHKKRVIFVSGEDVTWTDSNKLLDPKSEYYRENAIGVKTGSTPDAGYCLTGAEKINGRLYITVILGCKTRDDSYKDTITFLNEIMTISE